MNDARRREEEGIDLDGYCRAIEAHLCRKNDGHLIRIAGPAFDLVRGWAEMGVPLKVALAGMDRTFERYYRKGARRRPLQVSFCDADVLDTFDDWRRALGLGGSAGVAERGAATGMESPAGTGAGETASGATNAEVVDVPERPNRTTSLPTHLERVANRLTLLRGDPRNDTALEAALAGAVVELDSHRADARQARGFARLALISRLEEIDGHLLTLARARLSPGHLRQLAQDAAATLAPFRERMPRDAYQAALDAAVAGLVREQAGLPVIRYGG